MTPGRHRGSTFFVATITSLISLACGSSSEAQPAPTPPAKPAAPIPAPPGAKPETNLGVADKGIWGDLDHRVQLALPANLDQGRTSARIDRDRKLLVLSIDGFPRKVYPLTGGERLVIGTHELALRPGDKHELARLLVAERITVANKGADHDRDGIPDPLDVLVGAKKTVLNADAYTEGYKEITYPMGDVPRTEGVCTDVIVRAVRNAGIDLQRELHEDIARARAAYPMVKTKANYHVDQRRVRTLLPYFTRHWQKHTIKLDDPADPLRPGDVVFMDTFPSRSGPDHIGIVSDTIGDSGYPLIINNWTNGTVTAEMDLLSSVPILYRFRLPE
jgi:uncharacterized protein YijF (DUF1287 family)